MFKTVTGVIPFARSSRALQSEAASKTPSRSTKLLLLLLLGALFGVQHANAQSSTLLVDGSSGTDTGDCTSIPCQTIQYAIGKASAGDTIDVAAATYSESIVINKDNLTIQGDPGGSTIVDGETTIASVTGLTVQNLIMQNAGRILLFDSESTSDVALEDVSFDQVQFLLSGDTSAFRLIESNGTMAVSGANGLTFNNCVFDSQGHAMDERFFGGVVSGGPVSFDGGALRGTTYKELVNLSGVEGISFNNVSVEEGSLYISGSSSVAVTNSEFINSGNLTLNGVNGATVSGNTFENFTYGTRVALNLTATWGELQNSDVMVENNSFANVPHGVAVWTYTDSSPDSDFLTVLNNSFENIGTYAVYNAFDTFSVDATCNWWGDASGPSGEGPGSGNEVTGGVSFLPWNTTPTGPCDGVEPFADSVVAASTQLISGQAGESVAPGEPLPTVQVLDQYQNPVEGVTVGFEVTSGGGSISGATQITDNNGLAQVGGWTLGPDDTQTLIASAPGLTGSPVEFTAEVDPVVELGVAIDDGRPDIEPGERNTYTVTVSNGGPNDAEDVTVEVTLPAVLEATTADWSCFPGAGASCGATSGTGSLVDTGADVGAGASLIYVLEVNVDESASGIIEVEAVVEAGDVSASDADATQVVITEDLIFSDRFEEATTSSDVGESSTVSGEVEVSSNFEASLTPTTLVGGRDASDGEVFRIRTLGAGDLDLIRMEVLNRQGDWTRGKWIRMDAAAQQSMMFEFDAELGALILVGSRGEGTVQSSDGAKSAQSLYTDVPSQVTIRTEE